MMRISSQSCVLENVQSQIEYYFGPEEVIIDQLCDTTNPSFGIMLILRSNIMAQTYLTN